MKTPELRLHYTTAAAAGPFTLKTDGDFAFATGVLFRCDDSLQVIRTLYRFTSLGFNRRSARVTELMVIGVFTFDRVSCY